MFVVTYGVEFPIANANNMTLFLVSAIILL